MAICYHDLKANNAYLHRGDTGRGAGVCCESREWCCLALGMFWLAYTLHYQLFCSYRCLDILELRTGGKVGGASEGLGDGNHVRAVDQRFWVLTKDRKLSHRSHEGIGHVSLLSNIILPEASSPRICHQCQ